MHGRELGAIVHRVEDLGEKLYVARREDVWLGGRLELFVGRRRFLRGRAMRCLKEGRDEECKKGWDRALGE